MTFDFDAARRRLLDLLGLPSPPERLDQALTHPSYANEHRQAGVQDNQRLEFLGDAVLDICVSELLLDRLPDADEGALSRAYAALVNADALARWGRQSGVGDALRLGKGASSTSIRGQTNVLADAVEAIVAAVYLEGGMSAARPVAELMVAEGLNELKELTRRDAKSELQEWVQAHGSGAPRYVLLDTRGPDHDREFVVGVEIKGEILGRGTGRTKKGAEQSAAAQALEHREGSESSDSSSPPCEPTDQGAELGACENG